MSIGVPIKVNKPVYPTHPNPKFQITNPFLTLKCIKNFKKFILFKSLKFIQSLPLSHPLSIQLLHEAVGHIITIELKSSGALYRGKLFDAEDNLNIQLKEITVTHRDGRVSQLDACYVRGSQISFFIVPDMLKNAPFFKTFVPGSTKGKG